jgi:hypothetical protein
LEKFDFAESKAHSALDELAQSRLIHAALPFDLLAHRARLQATAQQRHDEHPSRKTAK